MGHEVNVVSLLPGNAEMPFKGKMIQLGRPLGKRFMDVKGWRELSKHIGQFNPDVVQANAGDTLKYAVLSKLFFGWKVPIVFRNASTISLYMKTTWVRRFNRFLLSRVAYVVS